MRIIVHDYAGHPFQVQLSRALAKRNHEVLHLYCESTHTPRGALQLRPDDCSGWSIQGISLGELIPKNKFIKRYRMEAKYGRRLAKICREWCPEVVLSANTPSIAQYRLARTCDAEEVRLVWWIQDIYGLAAQRLLQQKLPVVGDLVGRYFIQLDKECARSSHAIVVISKDFSDVLVDWGVDQTSIHVVHNWAPLDELPQGPRDNEWSARHQLGEKLRFLYSGTLAMKHNPSLLFELARVLQEHRLGELIVISEGSGVNWLADKVSRAGLTTCRVLGFQPYESLPQVFAAADVLVAILEREAGVFSVPSKVLSYMCAGRPLLLAIPRENLAARTVQECGAGIVVDPSDVGAFCDAAIALATSPDQRRCYGEAARNYANATFDINMICDRFESILAPASDEGS